MRTGRWSSGASNREALVVTVDFAPEFVSAAFFWAALTPSPSGSSLNCTSLYFDILKLIFEIIKVVEIKLPPLLLP